MTLINRLTAASRAFLSPTEKKGMTLEELAQRLQVSGLSTSVAGVPISIESAIQIGAMLACARVIADGCATPSLEVYREERDGTRIRAVDETAYRLLHRQPNPWMTSFTFRRTMTAHAVIAGDAVALKTRLGGNVLELIPIPPAMVTIERLPNWIVRYHLSDPHGGYIGTLGADDVFHLMGVSWDGFQGISTVKVAREALGLASRMEKTQAELHRNGLKTSGFLTTDKELGGEQVDRIKKTIDAHNSGRPGGVMVLDLGFEFAAGQMSMADAQMNEQRRFQIEEICRFCNVFPQVIGQHDKSQTYGSAEAFFAAHDQQTIAPWHENWAQELDRQVLDGQGPLFAKFNASPLLRASVADRAQAGRSLAEAGILTRNEIRRDWGFDPLDGLDEPLTPLNMSTGDSNNADP